MPAKPAIYNLANYRRGAESVLVSPASSKWETAVAERMTELARLEHGWDGFSASRVRPDAAYFAANFINGTFDRNTLPPFIAPLVSGGLQLEWHLDGLDVEVEIEGPNHVRAWIFDHTVGEEEILMEADFSKFLPCAARLVDPATTSHSNVA